MEVLLIVITLINLGLVATRFLKIKEPETSQNRAMFSEDSVLKENLFFNAMIDENKTIKKGIKLPEEPVLILRFSYRNCDVCRNSALFEFKRFRELTNSNRLKAMGSFMSNQDLKVFLKNEDQFSFNITNEANDYFGLELENKATEPFFFMLFPNGKAGHVFIPLKEDLPRTRRYLEIIYQKYFKNEN